MKKIFLIVVVALGASFVSCSNNSDELEHLMNKKEVELNQEFYATQKVEDSTVGQSLFGAVDLSTTEDSLPTDTGGQNGSNPIKP